MSKLSGRKFFITVFTESIFFILSESIIIPCIVNDSWGPAIAMIPVIIGAIVGVAGWFITGQVIQEHNISKDFQKDLVGK